MKPFNNVNEGIVRISPIVFCFVLLAGEILSPRAGRAQTEGDQFIRGYENLQKLKVGDFKGAPDPNQPGLDAATAASVDVKTIDVDRTLGKGQQVTFPDGRKFWIFRVEKLDWKDVEFATVFDSNRSWWRDPSENGDLLEHEKGHIAITEVLTRQANAKKKKLLAELKTKKFGRIFVEDTGQNESAAQVEADSQLNQALCNDAKSVFSKLCKPEIDQWKLRQSGTDVEGSYDQETDHGTKTEGQKRWTSMLETELTPIPTGKQAKSESKDSVSFDAATGILSIDNDFITGIGDDLTDDEIVGAAFELPDYVLNGSTIWGDPLFAAVGDPQLTLADGSRTFMTATLPYMVYSGNTFFGVMPSANLMAEGSAFVAGLQSAFDSGEPSLLGLQITPDEDFAQLTDNFTANGSIGFKNSFGLTRPIPEPSTVFLLGAGLAGLWRYRRVKRRPRGGKQES